MRTSGYLALLGQCALAASLPELENAALSNQSHPLAQNDVYNPISGGPGGQPFQAIAPGEETVATINIWCDWASAPDYPYITKGIQLGYTGGGQSSFYGSSSTDMRYYNFDSDEIILDMTLRAYNGNGGRLDGIEFRTNKGALAPCGTGGNPYPQNVGNGKLKGFIGRSARDIDAAGSVFQSR